MFRSFYFAAAFLLVSLYSHIAASQQLLVALGQSNTMRGDSSLSVDVPDSVGREWKWTYQSNVGGTYDGVKLNGYGVYGPLRDPLHNYGSVVNYKVATGCFLPPLAQELYNRTGGGGGGGGAALTTIGTSGNGGNGGDGLVVIFVTY